MINSCPATWYDGRTSQSHEVKVTFDGANVLVSGEGIDLCHPLAKVRIDSGLGNTRRIVRFPDGSTAEATADDFLDQLLRKQGKGAFFSGIHRWEMNPRKALTALLITLVVAFCFVRFGIPFLAKKAAFVLPAATEELIGRETLQVLDRLLMEPTRIPEGRRKELTQLFSSMVAPYPERKGWRLEFRNSEAIGSNAFALPSGIVIVTDALVGLARNDNEIAGILAHEIGHVNHRHALRHLMQNSATTLLIATLTGDITSISSIAATMPTVLIDAKYSRDFEREADDAAVAYLKGRGVPVKVYAEMLARLDADHWKERDAAPSLGGMLDDHPVMRERIIGVMNQAAESP